MSPIWKGLQHENQTKYCSAKTILSLTQRPTDSLLFLKRATQNLLILLPRKWRWDSWPYYHLYGSLCMLQRFDWDSQAQVLFIFWGWSLVKIPGKAFVHSTAGPAVPFAIYMNKLIWKNGILRISMLYKKSFCDYQTFSFIPALGWL